MPLFSENENQIAQPEKDVILGLERSKNNRIAGYIWRCALSRLDMSKSQMIFGEVFLWGCQTAQLRCGVEPKSPKFIVDAGLVLNRRGNKVLGWHLKMKDGSSEFMRYSSTPKSPAKAGEIFLRPVVKGIKNRKQSAGKAARQNP